MIQILDKSDVSLNLIDTCPTNLNGLEKLVGSLKGDTEKPDDVVEETNETTEDMKGAITIIKDGQEALRKKETGEESNP